jgi:hypothetical protein
VPLHLDDRWAEPRSTAATDDLRITSHAINSAGSQGTASSTVTTIDAPLMSSDSL